MNAESPIDALVEAAVREAWRLTLPDAPPDARTTWAEAGGDSLAALHLALRLEAGLGRTVPLELITTETTVPALATRLSTRKQAPRCHGFPVFLVPGHLGDSASWAPIRQAVGSTVAFETAAMPDLESATAGLEDLEWTAQRVAEDIMQRQPSGGLVLAGYSFGACVAHETARQLAAAGRHVARLVLLDPWIPEPAGAGARPVLDAARKAWRLLIRQRQKPAEYLQWLGFVLLFHLGAREAARRLLRAPGRRLEPLSQLRRRIHFLGQVRVKALLNWRPQPVRSPVLLAISDQHAEQRMAIWLALCPDHELVRLRGGHGDVFTPEAVNQLLPPLRAAFGPARVTSRSHSGQGRGP